MGHIKLRNLGFRFEGRQEHSLEDISLQVEQGETLLLAGRSGSGKSTLLHCLNGLIPEYYPGTLHGCIRVDNDTTSWRDIPMWRKASITGTVFQDPRHQFFSARVKQEIMLSLWRDNASPQDKKKKIDTILARTGLHHLRHRLLDSLSSGEQQRVAIGTAISSSPKILILDEPSANLSADGIDALLQFLGQAKEAGTTIIIAEHRFSWLRKLVDTLVVLDVGTVAYQGDAGKLNDQNFCRQFGLRFHGTKGAEQDKEETDKKMINGVAVLMKLDHVGFRYKKQQDWLWRNVTLQIHGGEIIALTGKNGCGKTTLLGLIFGLHNPVEGMIDLPHNNAVMALALQHPDLQLFSTTVFEEIKSSGKEGEKWLERFKLLSLRNRHPLTLSGGEMQRLVLAIAFARVSGGEPGLLLLDEPTSGMDGQQLQSLSREIQLMKKEHHAVVMATHDRDLLQTTGAVTMEIQSS